MSLPRTPVSTLFGVNPCGHAGHGRAEFPFLVLAIRLVLLEQRPEFLRVIQMNGVAEFMDQHVLGQVPRDEKQFLVQADGLAS